mmetsp:Transcript_66708/g.186422  ORF Transcript_66708/g.186422 Transcript_66708/m.186422 type:complete len:432 (-) Transcript_66708:831-2126(-)
MEDCARSLAGLLCLHAQEGRQVWEDAAQRLCKLRMARAVLLAHGDKGGANLLALFLQLIPAVHRALLRRQITVHLAGIELQRRERARVVPPALVEKLHVAPRVGQERVAEGHLGRAVGLLSLVLAAQLLEHLKDEGIGRGRRVSRRALVDNLLRLLHRGLDGAAVARLVLQGAQHLVHHLDEVRPGAVQGLRLVGDVLQGVLGSVDRGPGAVAHGAHEEEVRPQALAFGARADRLRLAPLLHVRRPGVLLVELAHDALQVSDDAVSVLGVDRLGLVQHALHLHEQGVRVLLLPQGVLELRIEPGARASLRRGERLQEGDGQVEAPGARGGGRHLCQGGGVGHAGAVRPDGVPPPQEIYELVQGPVLVVAALAERRNKVGLLADAAPHLLHEGLVDAQNRLRELGGEGLLLDVLLLLRLDADLSVAARCRRL